MNGGKTSLAEKLLALAVAVAYLGIMAYIVAGVLRHASAEMARVRAKKPSGAVQIGAQIGRLLPKLRRLR